MSFFRHGSTVSIEMKCTILFKTLKTAFVAVAYSILSTIVTLYCGVFVRHMYCFHDFFYIDSMYICEYNGTVE